MIKKIHINNFKGIKDTVTIELKPITLLFGPNSAGKSTILHALLYTKEIMERWNVDPKNTKTGGASINFGGFENLVFNQKFKDLPIVLKFEYELDEDLPDVLFNGDHTEAQNLFQKISGNSNSVYIELTIKWVKSLEKPLLVCYEIGINEQIVGKIEFFKSLQSIDYYNISYINHNNLALPYSSNENMIELFYRGTNTNSENISIVPKNLFNCLPMWDKPLEFDESYIIKENLENEKEKFYVSEYIESIGALFISIGNILLEDLKKLKYIGPIREIPSRKFDSHKADEKERWSNGLAAWDALYNGYPHIDLINKWMNKLNTGYKFELLKFKEIPLDAFDDSQNGDNLFKYLKEIRDSVNLRLSDVDKIRFELEEKTLKIFAEAKISIEQRYNDMLGPSQKLKNFIPTLIGTSIGALTGPVGIFGGILGGLVTSYFKKDISKEHFENEVNNYMTGIFKEEEKKFLKLVNEIEKVNSLTEEKLNDLFVKIREEIQFRLTDTLEKFQEEIKHMDTKIDHFKEDILPSLSNLNIMEISKAIPTKSRVYLVDSEKNINILPQDVGVGISQVVPVIIGALAQSESIMAVEQPELHIHPKMQVELADLFIDQINRTKKVIFLIETHSEHLFLRLLKRIRNNESNEYPLKIEDFAINTVEIFDGSVLISQFQINEKGHFQDRWPKGFFEERKGEMF